MSLSGKLRILRRSRAHDPDGGRELARPDHRSTPPAPQGSPHGLELRETLDGDRCALLLVGTLDLGTVGTLERAITRVARAQPVAITLDLRGLSFIDSSGLWTITGLRKWCAQTSIEFRLIPGCAPVHEIFELTGLSDLLPFVHDDAGDGATGDSRGR